MPAGANTGANAARYGNAGLISLGITLSNTYATGLKIFLSNPIVSLYIVNIEASSQSL